MRMNFQPVLVFYLCKASGNLQQLLIFVNSGFADDYFGYITGGFELTK